MSNSVVKIQGSKAIEATNIKSGFAQSPAYLTKVKKELPVKTTKVATTESVDQRHLKINFKQYLRNLKEEQASDDEFQDIQVLALSALVKEDIRDEDDLLIEHVRVVSFGGDDGKLSIVEEDFEAILEMERDDSITVYDEFDERWYVSRTLDNLVVFESQEHELSGKISFDDFAKTLK